MKLDDKRKLIEALLIAAGDVNNVSLWTACEAVGVDIRPIRCLDDWSYDRWPAGSLRASDRYAQTAYHLACSSAELRREWFGVA